jgi:hypothetical protein
MSDGGGLTGTQAELIALWRAKIAARGWTQAEVDRRAQEDAAAHGERWGDGYCAKLLCGDREPTATTTARMNRVLGIRLHVQADAIMP